MLTMFRNYYWHYYCAIKLSSFILLRLADRLKVEEALIDIIFDLTNSPRPIHLSTRAEFHLEGPGSLKVCLTLFKLIN